MVRPDMAFGPLGGVVCRQRPCSQVRQRDRRDEHLIGQCRRIQTLQVDDGVGVEHSYCRSGYVGTSVRPGSFGPRTYIKPARCLTNADERLRQALKRWTAFLSGAGWQDSSGHPACRLGAAGREREFFTHRDASCCPRLRVQVRGRVSSPRAGKARIRC